MESTLSFLVGVGLACSAYTIAVGAYFCYVWFGRKYRRTSLSKADATGMMETDFKADFNPDATGMMKAEFKPEGEGTVVTIIGARGEWATKQGPFTMSQLYHACKNSGCEVAFRMKNFQVSSSKIIFFPS